MALKQKLNLRELKNDTSEKHRKIYEKATYLLKKGHRTPQLSYVELKVIADNFRSKGIKANVAISGDITIRSKCDDWIVIDEGRFYTLYHEVTVVMNNGKPRKEVHVQDIFEDLNYLFASVVTHDNYKMNIMNVEGESEISEVVTDVTSLDNIPYNISYYAC